MDVFDFFNNPQVNSIPVHTVNDDVLEQAGISLSILRCDLIHPQISGNKWFKLKYNLIAAREQNHQVLLSFGGAWSNHLHALAYAGKLFDFKTIGVVRGEPGENLNSCLTDAVANGMILHWASREEYQQKHEDAYVQRLKTKFGKFFLIPEGGGNLSGIKGCGEMLNPELRSEYDLLCLACGTGSTLAGLACSYGPSILGFQVLKGEEYLKQEVRSLLSCHELKAQSPWSINDQYHFGGYGKVKPELIEFIDSFYENTGIPLEPVYSGKMLFALYDLIKKNHFKKKLKILAVHGGGMQGARGFE